jgi:membrane-associated phospholipid phosphatase
LTTIVGRGALGLGVIVAVVVGAVLAFKRLRDPRERKRLADFLDRLGRRPLLRPVAVAVRGLWRFLLRPVWRLAISPLARWLGPPLRFLTRRLTPGELGIELTSLLAVAAVCGYVFGLYTDLVTGGSETGTPGDDAARDVSHDIQGGALTTAAKAISLPGAWPVTTAVVVVAAAILLFRYRRGGFDAAVLALGFGLSEAGVRIAKGLVGRPRPSDELVDIGGSSFPSGHAANAVAYLVLAVIVARALRTATWRVSVVVAGAVVAALIGLSRVYLRVHYLSDVTSGWALALAVFSLCGCVALIASYVRNNERPLRAPIPPTGEVARGDG